MIAKLLPPRVRQAVYVILATAVGLELIWDVFPAVVESKVLGSLTVLGFGLATANGTPKAD